MYDAIAHTCVIIPVQAPIMALYFCPTKICNQLSVNVKIRKTLDFLAQDKKIGYNVITEVKHKPKENTMQAKQVINQYNIVIRTEAGVVYDVYTSFQAGSKVIFTVRENGKLRDVALPALSKIELV
jgi:hypothetical protein